MDISRRAGRRDRHQEGNQKPAQNNLHAESRGDSRLRLSRLSEAPLN
jgi:hypothetical protein